MKHLTLPALPGEMYFQRLGGCTCDSDIPWWGFVQFTLFEVSNKTLFLKNQKSMHNIWWTHQSPHKHKCRNSTKYNIIQMNQKVCVLSFQTNQNISFHIVFLLTLNPVNFQGCTERNRMRHLQSNNKQQQKFNSKIHKLPLWLSRKKKCSWSCTIYHKLFQKILVVSEGGCYCYCC